MKCTGLIDDTVTIGIGGEAGQGVGRSGMLLGKALMRAGFYAFGNIDYPSLIRGGHNYYSIRTSHRKVNSILDKPDLVVALNKETILLHQDNVNPGGGIIYDTKEKIEDKELTRTDIEYYSIPMTDVVKELGGPDIMRNTIALGAVSALIGLESDYLKDVVSETFEGKDKIIKMNQDAINSGWEHVIEFDYGFKCSMESGSSPERMWLTGNEAVALGAVSAGCKFYAAYPMTPASAVLHYYTGHDEVTDSVVIQTESEIAAICMTVGASYAGVRSMTATSGGGFCLMTEGLSLAAMTESPIVVMLGQRPGPSTGLATFSAQGDLLFAVYGAHGEFQRIVLAPGDTEECFYMTQDAFNLAERFQIPVILLTDKNLLESHETVPMFRVEQVIDRGKLLWEWDNDEEYNRYMLTEDGVSPRVVPGTKNALIFANSNEHTERGFTTSVSLPTIEMVDKRFRKVQHIKDAMTKREPIKVYGSSDPDITLVGWGSTKGPALDAMETLKKEGVSARFIQVRVMEPFPDNLSKYLKEKVILFENNRSAELGTLIKLNTGYVFKHIGLRYDGRPFDPNEIVAKIKEVLA
ncbi:2-oxoacid:acceptor oxidoreductase subunit alpha [Candidatus Bathyarchaeota archaeon]|nr:MAG: 2-oxoacid:acceptor oxidoreductase subunit alpha [Candidatus Bathyarchaeota archaeon]